jgi:hypothetical protein
MGFTCRYLTKKLIIDSIDFNNIDKFKKIFITEGLALMDDFSIKIYNMFLKSKNDIDIKNIMKMCLNEK